MATAPAHHPGSTPTHHPGSTYTYLARAAESLQDAVGSTDVGLRYAQAHVAALRATAALLAARARPMPPGRRRPVQRNAWVLLAEVAPELGEWAAFFSAGAAKRAAAESGSARAVTAREADDLVREADRFLAVVERALEVARHVPVEERLPLPRPGQGPGSADGSAGRTGQTGRARVHGRVA